MQKNYFELARQSYHPRLPHLLQGIRHLDVIEEAVALHDESIVPLFPHTAHQPNVSFQLSTTSHAVNPQRIGVLFSGGQASGGHNVILGLFDALQTLHPNNRLIGFKGGPEGLIFDNSVELTADILMDYRNTGGFDLIGSGRTKIETPEQFEAVVKTVLSNQLTGLVVVGGDDSNTNAAMLAEYFKEEGIQTCVVGVPKTIDGDLKSEFIETSFGFDTATKVYSELIGNIQRDAISAKKYFHFVKLMGRSASHVTLECALQTHPNVAFIGEEIARKKITLSQITHSLADLISARANQGKNYGVALIPEGLIEFIPEMKLLIQELNRGELSSTSRTLLDSLPPKLQSQLKEERDSHGNVQVSRIGTEQFLIDLVKKELAQRTSFKGKFSPVNHFFGYEGRCAYPTNFDATYTQALGYAAVVLIQKGLSGYMARVGHLSSRVQDWEVGGVALASMLAMEERKGKQIPVIEKALVDLDGEPFRYFASHRDRWSVEDDYRYPPGIQYFGPEELTDQLPLSMQFENHLIAL